MHGFILYKLGTSVLKQEPNPSVVGQEIENVILHHLNTVLPAKEAVMDSPQKETQLSVNSEKKPPNSDYTHS